MGYISAQKKLPKVGLAQRQIKSWISTDTDKPYKEESSDAHPLRAICKVNSHQLDKLTKEPTDRHKYVTPNKAVVEMNDLVDRVINLNFQLSYRGEPWPKHAPPDPMVNMNGLGFTFFAGRVTVTKSITKGIKSLEDMEWRNKICMRE